MGSSSVCVPVSSTGVTETGRANRPLPPPTHPELRDYGKGSSVPVWQTLVVSHIACRQVCRLQSLCRVSCVWNPLALVLGCAAVWGTPCCWSYPETLISMPKVQFLNPAHSLKCYNGNLWSLKKWGGCLLSPHCESKSQSILCENGICSEWGEKGSIFFLHVNIWLTQHR